MKVTITKLWVKPQLKSLPVSLECTAYAGATS